MERFRINNGAPVAPPAGGVTASGRAVSNFAGRVRADAAFAAQNGYYPIVETAHAPQELLEGTTLPHDPSYTLVDEAWVREVKN
ncbi:MAG: hypothetical protein IJW51_04595 [Clostridia bacterium]|nr:hypothetical protein [Clostridia bacterium]